MDIANQFSNSSSAKAWNYFFELSKVPRPSGHEEKITSWLKDIAKVNNWPFKTDAIGNVAITVPGKGCLADRPNLVIQGHLDMVCEKNSGVEHDFLTEPLQLKSDGEWITATETTLGADNGVAIALGLALAEEELDNRLPIELLFTVAEETGLIGANNLDPELFSGKTVINIDSEEEGKFIIGCAGGEAVTTCFDITEIDKTPALKCTLTGLRGGHSGMDVGCRHNAIIAVGQILAELPEAKLHQVMAGDKANAIPRECSFTISGVSAEKVSEISERTINSIKTTEPDARLETEWTKTSQLLPNSVIDFISSVKNGVISMNPDFDGVVQTSTSVTVAKEIDRKLSILASTRSSLETEKFATNDKICALAENCGATTERFDRYPGWSPNKDSKILTETVKAYKEFSGNEPKVESIHAGLECGIIGSKINSTELISMGPTIKNPHSPEERLNISSFERIYSFLKELIQTDITS